jgi:ABC-type sugar transport system permease subunit
MIKRTRNLFSKEHAKEIFFGYAFIFPTIAAFLIFSLVPTIAVFVLGFYEWDFVNKPEFIGLGNYIEIFKSTEFWHVLWVTVKYVFYSQAPKLAIALFLALFLVKSLPGIKYFRIPIVLPWIAMPIAVAMVWKWILDPMSGLLNFYLAKLGISKIMWFSPDTVLQSIAVMDIWQYFGFTTILFMVGLQSIPTLYYEAANIDGAGRLRTFWSITLPLLKPTMLFVLITTIIGTFQVFDVVFSTTKGGPGDLSKVYYYLIYEKAFKSMQMGYASALCMILFVILMGLTLFQLRVFKDKTTN